MSTTTAITAGTSTSSVSASAWSIKLPAVNFVWPEMLWLLLALPLLVLLYWWLLRRKRKQAVNYTTLAIVKQAMAGARPWRRHVPPVLLLCAIAVMLVAGARPMTVITLPSNQKTIILAMDVSGSMRATDVQPSRIIAAQEAAKKFLEELPREVKVGIVAFAGAAQVAQLPTLSRDDLKTAIDRFQLQRGTATGNAIVISLATLFPDAGIELQQMGVPGRSMARGLNEPAPEAKKEHTPVPPGSYNSAAIIMLTDGQRTTGVDPMEAAKMAADRGVRVYTVGIGTVDGETIGFEGWSMRVRLDEETLKSVANRTDGDYYYAGSATDLKKVYEKLSSRISTETKETEVSGLLALLGAVLALFSATLSVLWFNRVL
jgi:Ca-activated chloride channel homolog